MRPIRLFKYAVIISAVSLAGCAGGHYDGDEQAHYRQSPPPRVIEERPAPAMVEQVVIEQPPEVVVTAFHDDLAPYGVWVNITGYGRCWRPNGVVATWQPYTIGHWVYTAYGWTWVSQEPWGPSTYHYGRWFEDPRHGWVWLPGSTWAPAWVAWRSGGGYVGWAPLGPDIHIGVSVRITDGDTNRIPASRFHFVEERRMTEPRMREHVVDVKKNVTIINKTTNITKITTINNKVVNQSLSAEQVQRSTGRKVEKVELKEVASPAEARKLREKDQPVAFRPKPLDAAEKARIETATRRENERLKAAQNAKNNTAKPEPARGKAGEPKKAPPAKGTDDDADKNKSR